MATTVKNSKKKKIVKSMYGTLKTGRKWNKEEGRMNSREF